MTEKLNVAIIGMGGMGGTHTDAAKASPYVDRIIGYEPNPERAALRGKELGIEYTSDFNEILKDSSINVASIASINEVHCEQTIASLKAGKSVICEKPMGLTLAEARQMLKAEQETGNFLQVGFELHYSKIYMMVKEWIDQGLIGQPLNSHCRYYCSEFHLKDTWRSNATGSFLIGEKLSHYLDLPRWWFGQEIDEVYSMAAPNFVPYFKHRDNHQINYKYKNGAISNLNFIMGLAETDHGDPLQDLLEKQSDDGHSLEYTVYGEKGAIQTDVFRRRIRRWEFTDGPKQLESKIVESISYTKEDDNLWIHNTKGQNIHLFERIAKGLKPDNPASDSFETMKLCFAAEMSEDENRVVKMSEL